MYPVHPIAGCLRRQIDLRRAPDGAVVGWLEDDFHHFGVTLTSKDGRIADIRIKTIRAPFSTCGMAEGNLRGAIERPLSPRCTDFGVMVTMREQCTHMFDLAGLAMAHAALGRDRRRYEAIIPDREAIDLHARPIMFGKGSAWLLRDGEEVMRWNLEGDAILSPENLAGQSIHKGFRERTKNMPLEEAEAASVLRRVIIIAAGRSLNLDLLKTARGSEKRGVCYTFQDENLDRGIRMVGSTIDYAENGDAMLAHRAMRP